MICEISIYVSLIKRGKNKAEHARFACDMPVLSGDDILRLCHRA